MRVLAGDVGGTNTRLAVCEVEGNAVTRVFEDVQPSEDHVSFTDVVRTFIERHDVRVEAVAFGLPGPIRGRKAVLTNLPWIVDADVLEWELGLPRVGLINDLVANAYGLHTLDPEDFAELRVGVPDEHGNLGLVSAGTGLGEAGVQVIAGRLYPFATEGGHGDFAPSNALEDELLRYLRARHGGHVSWERVVSGPGITAIYEFLRDSKRAEEPAWLREVLADADDPSAVIGRAGVEGKSEIARATLELFLALYGAEAGNLALKLLATGGIYLGGGIPPKLLRLFEASPFLARFDDKGRLRGLVETIPIRIVLDDKAALQGAAVFAASQV